MFKSDSFEEELYSSMKKNLATNSREESLKEKKANFKAVNFLNSVAEILEKSGFANQAEAITSFMNKRVGLKTVVASFQDKQFLDKLDKDSFDNLRYCLKQAGFSGEDVNKMLDKKHFSEYDQLLDVKYTRAMKPVLSFSNPVGKEKVNIDNGNAYLNKIKNIITKSAMDQEVDFSSPITVTENDFEDE